MGNKFNHQNDGLLELEIDLPNEETAIITQISYNRKGEVKRHGEIAIKKSTMKSILNAMEELSHNK